MDSRAVGFAPPESIYLARGPEVDELRQVFGERQYDFTERKKRRMALYGNSFYDLEVARGNLHDFDRIMRELGLSFFCHQGTLLGAARAGTLISHDTDIDVGVIDFDEGLLTRALQRLEIEGFSVVRTACDSWGFIDFVTIMKSDEYIDIHCFLRTSRFGRKVVVNKGFYSREGLFDSFAELRLEGLAVLAPRGYEALLDSWYGRDWRVPRVGLRADSNGWASKIIAVAHRFFVTAARRILRRSSR